MQPPVTASPLNGTSYAGSSYKIPEGTLLLKIPKINEILVSLDM